MKSEPITDNRQLQDYKTSEVNAWGKGQENVKRALEVAAASSHNESKEPTANHGLNRQNPNLSYGS